jgi:drug/metabolite transporter (DMT)-like permease
MKSASTKGVYFALITAVISGFSIFLNKYAVSIVTPPLYFTALKNVGVGVLILAVILATKKFSQIRSLTRKELTLLVLISLIGGTVPFYLFFTGLASTSAINAAILQKTLVVWVALLSWPLLKEKMTKSQIFAVLMLFAGNLFVGGFKGFKFSQGELMIFGSTIFWAIEYLLAKKVLKTVHPDIVVTFRMALGSLFLIGAALLSPAKAQFNLTSNGLFWVILSVGLLFGYVITWYRALQLTKATTVVSILVSSTLITNILSAVFVTKSISPTFIVQALLIIVGTGILVVTSRREELVDQSI